MNCAELRSLVGLEDSVGRPDRAALQHHLEGCPRCARQHPEIAWMLAAAPARRSRRTLLPRSLAAAAVVLATVLAAPASRESPSRPQAVVPAAAVAEAAPAAPLPRGRPFGSRTTYTRTAITHHRGHAVSTTMTCRQWAAEPALTPEESSD
jgi:hypothetical protein